MTQNAPKRLDALRAMTEVTWDAAQEEYALGRYARYRARRRRRTRVVRGGACLALVALALIFWPEDQKPVDGTHQFTDGSVARVDNDSQWHIETERSDLVQVALVRGRARFNVRKNRDRMFRVKAGPVRVEVLGTTFSVLRIDSAVTVSVSEGQVRVTGPEGTHILAEGESMRVDEAPVENKAVVEPPEPTAKAPTDAPQTTKKQRWQKSAKRGDVDRAFELLKNQRVKNEAEELLLAADVARMSGHPEAALPYLRKVVSAHGMDPRAALASFTLGKLLLQELGRPRRAADAFRQVRLLNASSALQEDALAREVECYFRIGDEDRARGAAEHYVRKYPGGSHRGWVERYGGLHSSD